MQAFVIREPAEAWFATRGGSKAQRTRAERVLEARLKLVLDDIKAAEEEAVLEALALTESVRTHAMARLGLSSRTFYDVMERNGMPERVLAQELRLGHKPPPGPRGRARK